MQNYRIINIEREDGYYIIYYLNGDPKGVIKYWHDLSVSDKLEIVNWFEQKIK